jgi:hypothetical protein
MPSAGKKVLGIGLLPKHDILRQLCEKIELKHKGNNLSKAFRKYDTDGSGICMGLLYERTGRLNTKTGGFRPGQRSERPSPGWGSSRRGPCTHFNAPCISSTENQ